MTLDLTGHADRTDAQALDRRQSKIVAAAAVADSLSPVPYFLGIDPVVIQAPALILKLLLVIMVSRAPSTSHRRSFFLLSVAAVTVTAALGDAAFGIFSWAPILRYLAFLASMFATLVLVRPDHYRVYAAWLVPIPLIGAVGHAALAILGALPAHYGRYFYFLGSHPNLGGEIAAIAGIAAALSYRLARFIPINAVLLLDCLLLQARAAIVVLVLCLALRVGWADKRRAALVVIPIALLVLGLVISGTLDPLSIAESALRLDDPLRGAGSGFAGRDVRWDHALALFSAYPLTGAGLAIFDAPGAADPHNAFLYGLASHGVLSFSFWLTIAGSLYLAAKRSVRDFMILSVGGVLLVFNDRFINLNIYPFAYYVLILAYPLMDTAQGEPAR